MAAAPGAPNSDDDGALLLGGDDRIAEACPNADCAPLALAGAPNGDAPVAGAPAPPAAGVPPNPLAVPPPPNGVEPPNPLDVGALAPAAPNLPNPNCAPAAGAPPTGAAAVPAAAGLPNRALAAAGCVAAVEPPAPNAKPGVAAGVAGVAPAAAGAPNSGLLAVAGVATVGEAPNRFFGATAPAGVAAVSVGAPPKRFFATDDGVAGVAALGAPPNKFFGAVEAGVAAGVAPAAGVAAGVAAAAGFGPKLNPGVVGAVVAVASVGALAPSSDEVVGAVVVVGAPTSAGLMPNEKPLAAGAPVAAAGLAAAAGAPVVAVTAVVAGLTPRAVVVGAEAVGAVVAGTAAVVFGAPTAPKLNAAPGVAPPTTAAGFVASVAAFDGGWIEPNEKPLPAASDVLGSAIDGLAAPSAAGTPAPAPNANDFAAGTAAAAVVGVDAAVAKLARPLSVDAGFAGSTGFAATGAVADGTAVTVAFGVFVAGLMAATAAATSSSSTANVRRRGTATSGFVGSSAIALTSADNSAKFDTPGERLRPTGSAARGLVVGAAAVVGAGFAVATGLVADDAVLVVGNADADERTDAAGVTSSSSSCAVVSLTRNACCCVPCGDTS